MSAGKLQNHYDLGDLRVKELSFCKIGEGIEDDQLMTEPECWAHFETSVLE